MDSAQLRLVTFPSWGGRLRDARRERGLRQEDVAEIAGVWKNTISRWERGTSSPTFLDVVGLASLLGKPYQWFYGVSGPFEDRDLPVVPREVELRSRVDALVSLIFAGAEARRVSLENVLGLDAPAAPASGRDDGAEESDFVSLYSLSVAAGPTFPAVDDEEVVGRIRVDQRPFRAVAVNPGNCDLIVVSGDSMEPTLADGSMVLVDRGARELRDGRIFVLRTPDGLLVKRVHMDGVRWLAVSDNPGWPAAVIDPDSTVIGQVRWSTLEV